MDSSEYLWTVESEKFFVGYCFSYFRSLCIKQVLDIIAEAGLLGCKRVLTPIEQNHKLLSDKGPLYKDPAWFRRIVCPLVYLTITRPELCYVVHVVSSNA